MVLSLSFRKRKESKSFPFFFERKARIFLSFLKESYLTFNFLSKKERKGKFENFLLYFSSSRRESNVSCAVSLQKSRKIPRQSEKKAEESRKKAKESNKKANESKRKLKESKKKAKESKKKVKES